jgi:HEAT repeat protein
LIQTALYDTGGEIIEGAFVDRWESYALNAVDALAEIFEREGFSEADAALIRQAVSELQAPVEAVLTLVSELGKWTHPLLEAMRDDPSPRARIIAVRALGNTRTLWLAHRKLDSAALLRGLEDSDASVREAAVQTLAQPIVRREVENAETALALALDDEDPRVRIAAGSTLGFFDRPDIADALVARLKTETDETARRAVLLAVAGKIKAEGVHSGYGGRAPLRKRVGEPLLAVLLNALTHPEAQVRQEVVGALHCIDGLDVAEALLELLRWEKNPDVRYALLRYPDRQYFQIPNQALPVFSALLVSDSSLTIRVQLVWVLKCFGDKAVPLILSALDDPNAGVRSAARRVLEMMGRLPAS